jgi:hypothetical protein
MKTLPLLVFVGFVGLSSLRAAVDISLSAEIRLGKTPPPSPPEVIVIEAPAHRGPPPWAPAHGARRTHAFYYYPGTHVYFRPADRVWFYLEGREWRFGVSLPASVRIDFDRSVSLTMAAERPDAFHDHVKVAYPADYFVTKVRVKEKGDKPDKGNSGRGDDDSPGRSKGKGKGKNS